MSLYEQYDTNRNKEKDGVWFNFGPGENGDIRIKIARAGGSNKKFLRVVDRVTRPHRRAIDTEKIDPELLTRLNCEALAESVVLDWENVTDRDGNSLPCTKANVEKILMDLPDLYRDIMKFSQDMKNYQDAAVEVEKGN